MRSAVPWSGRVIRPPQRTRAHRALRASVCVRARRRRIVSRVTLTLDLTTLPAQCELSPRLLGSYAEAAEVVLDRFHGEPGPPCAARIEEQRMPVDARVIWERSTEQARSSHDNRIDASELAACAVAISAAHAHLGLRVVRRALHASGADFLMRRLDAAGDDFERLEVGGITSNDSPPFRLREKVEQLRRGNDRRPGCAVVVAFPGDRVRVLMERVS